MVDADGVFDDWTQNEDGIWVRRAARVIAVDADLRVLMLRGVDPADPSNIWWFTPGGGIEARESDRAAAARELFEESGLVVQPEELVGPVAERVGEFSYLGRRCRQYEALFFVEIAGEATVHDAGWTDVERASVTQVRWCELRELAASGEPFYPRALASIVHSLVVDGWDGGLRAID